MADDEIKISKLSRKEKRLRWWKKKNENTEKAEDYDKVEVLNTQTVHQTEDFEQSSGNEVKVKKSKKRKHERKESMQHKAKVEGEESDVKNAQSIKIIHKDAVQDGEDMTQLKKKKKKKKSKELQQDGSQAPKIDSEHTDSQKKKKKKNKFYVLFVGNIPYKASVDEIKDHFKGCGEIHDIRLATVKETGKSRGFAYVELKTNNAYKKALALHHTELRGREINVEITNPGRGTSMLRKQILMAKNKEFRMYGDNYG